MMEMRGEVGKKIHKKRDGEYDVTGKRGGAKVMYFGLRHLRIV